MTNSNLISKYPEFFTLLEKLHKENIYFILDKLSNRLTMHNKNSIKKMEYEDIAAYFWKTHNVNLNPGTIITIIRGYFYQNLATEEDNNNIIKDDFYYSILEFTKNKSNIKLNDLCIHLFNLNSNKVKQEIRTHICRCLTEIGFISKRTENGIKWIKNNKEPTCLQENSETIDNKDLQAMYPEWKEPTLSLHSLHETKSVITDNLEKEISELKLMLEEKDKLIQKLEIENKELNNKTISENKYIKKIEELEEKLEESNSFGVKLNQDKWTSEKKLKEEINTLTIENKQLKEEIQNIKDKKENNNIKEDNNNNKEKVLELSPFELDDIDTENMNTKEKIDYLLNFELNKNVDKVTENNINNREPNNDILLSTEENKDNVFSCSSLFPKPNQVNMFTYNPEIQLNVKEEDILNFDYIEDYDEDDI